MNIQEANGLLLRPAMTITADVQQTSELPQNVSASNVENLPTHARITDTSPVTRIMDLTGDGFLNDGNAYPVTDDGSKYGYISQPTDSSGHWVNPPSITMTCRSEWDVIGILVQDLDGNETEVEFEEITWNDGTCTLTFTEFEPNKRMYITAIHLGKTFHFSNDDLISLSADLRGINTSLDEGSIELEMSSVELSAYCGEGADRWINVFASMDKSSPCRISMGYPEDSVTRAFYVAEQPSYDVSTKVLTVRMADATQMLEDTYGGKYIGATTATIAREYYDAIKDILDSAGIEYTESGTVPQGAGTGASNLMITNESKRNIIADAVTLFRDPTKLAITYRDGGIPQLIAGQTNAPTWEINEEDVSELTTDIEYIVRDYSANLSEYSVNATAEEVAGQQGAVAGEVYFLECSEPVHDITAVTKGTAEIITPYTVKFTCTTSGDATITGHKIIETATSQYKTESSGKGVSVTLNDMQFVNAGVRTSIPDYTMCEYIQSSGTQYINTGYVPTTKTGVEMDFQFTTVEASKTLFGSRPNTVGDAMSYQLTTNSNKQYQARASLSSSTATGKTANTTRTQLGMGNGSITISGGVTYSGSLTQNGTTTYPLFIFANNQQGSVAYQAKIKLYSFRIYEDGELVRNYVPAYDSNGVIGLYDMVTDNFLTNAGTGTFTKGPDIPAYETISLTKNGMTELLRESNLKHNFVWRGNPHWQTHDHILMHMIDGTTKKMTLVAQTFTFEGGGLSCECQARKGWF